MSADQHAALICIATMFLGLFIAAGSWSWSMRCDRRYREADAIDFSNEVWAELDREAS